MAEDEKTKNYAIGHRERVRKKFLESGFNNFEDYEVLELLLFYVIPRKDTKAIAKELIAKFKTLANVLKADNKELKTINGLGDVAITFLKMMGALPEKIYEDKLKNEKIIKDDTNKITNKEILLNFFRNKIGYKDVEKFYVIYLSSSNEVLAFEESSSGTLDRSSIYPREIYKRVIMENAKSIIIAHNHPSGNISPSKCDIDITNEIAKGLKNFGALLIEHIIITRDSYFSFLEEGLI
ncbi:DNA repair protein RadC [Fusobacterium sp. oral taxon 370 str. F0437]|uniref:RadC family protein n=1 Tax=Fusobacterium sp. oral taxon 370 TaxID=712288 RepID=UPI000234AD55|nr:DNA repair protein RadC [Fusobacterium sp. oral taxon 370]EHI79196.1 DNA repair protein RadC [Fusobacterium sp. oral taxon 370 str. F0437]